MSKRWRPKFSLRALFILITALSVLFAWIGWNLNGARRQRAAIDSIRQHGGYVLYDFQRDADGNFDQLCDSSCTAWLRGITGDDLLGTAALAEVSTDECASYIAQLPRLQRVYLVGPGLTDAALPHLAGLRELELLDIAPDNHFTEIGIKNLSGLSNLKYLRINVDIEDTALRYLQDLQHLESLQLHVSSRLTPAGLRLLKGIQRLRVLVLNGGAINDATVDGVRDLPHLKYLKLESAHVSKAAIERLRKEMPGCDIEFERQSP